MPTTLEQLKERYSKTEREPDALGRMITVGMLRPSQETRVREWIAAGAHSIVNNTLFIAASVRQIDQGVFPFPRSREELDATLDALDREGLEAASKAVERLHGLDKAAGEQPTQDVVEAAKN